MSLSTVLKSLQTGAEYTTMGTAKTAEAAGRTINLAAETINTTIRAATLPVRFLNAGIGMIEQAPNKIKAVLKKSQKVTPRGKTGFSQKAFQMNEQIKSHMAQRGKTIKKMFAAGKAHLQNNNNAAHQANAAANTRT